jgi:hypothetical protein
LWAGGSQFTIVGSGRLPEADVVARPAVEEVAVVGIEEMVVASASEERLDSVAAAAEPIIAGAG